MKQTMRSLLALVLLAGSVVAVRGMTPGDYRPNEICAVAGDIDLCLPPEDGSG